MQIVQGDRKNRMEWLREDEGYFTVEASFLVPILCFLVMGILIVSLYLCDVSFAKSYLQGWVINCIDQEDFYGENREAEKKRELEESLFVAKVEKLSLTKKYDRIEGVIIIKMSSNVPLVGEWMGQLWRNSLTFKADRVNNTEQMRRWDQLE